jgi:glutamine amidotransferase
VSPRVALVDYGAGNLASVRKALTACGAEVFTPSAPPALRGATAIVVPGVGHFGATSSLGDAWRSEILARLACGVPLLGICLGMQWLFEGSEEEPACPGLALLQGRCSLLRPESDGQEDAAPAASRPARHGAAERREAGGGGIKVPHVGWNDLEVVRPSVLLAGIVAGDQAYFTHSYAAPVTADCVAATTYGVRFASAVERGRVFGTQFHPEKSGDVGLTILGNFIRAVSQR